ncbi:PREDICTED: receptor-type tyrosine-protein phosphatase alpha-like [Amphimedon queenslandica]|uniref:Uncharacterized protein n=2 Tax=Amphimedon queenslandica TaxID=400682 RepID=A0AAN0JE65_AMPQE|nr:PREDICTED: receptor-type tyrosine-protein phosphatase alpha-like [Amphimedon queenslandica]|eukprot:XP_019855284.1 PREDICTED: receptor-type tyrosine-protein phosphatase alpha-like [Amphimedon queenslandica]
MLTKLEEKQQECSFLYWSDLESRQFGEITIELIKKKEEIDYLHRQFKIAHLEQPEASYTLHHFQFLGWPERGVPVSALPLLQMIQNVQELYITLRTTEPITVMCSSGVGRTGVFIALGIVLERYSVEGMIDLFQTVKTLRIQRSAMVQTREQYHFCYEAILDYLLNTGQLPRIRSVSVDRRSSVYRTTATPASSPPSQGSAGLTSSTVEMASAFKNTSNDDNGSLLSPVNKASAL